MIVSRLEQYLREHRRAALSDMAIALNADADALRPMLGMLERKGRIRRLPAGTACGGGCSKCHPSTIELYEWGEPLPGIVSGPHAPLASP